MAFSRSARISLLLFIDVIFFLVEIITGYAVGSLALVADSFHMLNDILSLIVALYAIKLTSKNDQDNNDTRYSYGWHRAEILAALVNGVFLLALCFSIFMEAIERFFSTPEISNPKLVVIVGSLGLASNIFGLFLFHDHDHSHDHGHAPAQKQSDDTAAHTHQINDADRDDVTENTVVEDRRGSTREDEDSLFGHPVATRAYVVQTAQDMQSARSPSITRGGRQTSPSGRRKSNKSLDHFTSQESVTDRTPLLSDTKASQSNSDSHAIHSHESTNDTAITMVDQKPSGHNHSKSGSMNMRALVLHVLGDALGNVGVIATGLVIWLTTLSWKFYFDPIISLVITVIIFSSALPLVKSASFILLQGVPAGISLQEVEYAVRDVDGVLEVHELHIWQLSESKVIASLHVHSSQDRDFMQVAAEIRKKLHDRGIHSVTIQPEYDPSLASSSGRISPGKACLLRCPPDQHDCNPTENACCPPPSADV